MRLTHSLLALAAAALGTLSSAGAAPQAAAQDVRAWTWNVGGHLSAVNHTTTNYEYFLKQVDNSKLPDFVGCQEAVTDTNTAITAALNKRRSGYQLLAGAPRGGLAAAAPDEMASIIWDSTRWTRIVPDAGLKALLDANQQDVLENTWGLNPTPSELGKLTSQAGYSFQLTLRDPDQGMKPLASVGGPAKDSKVANGVTYGPFSRLATWGIFQNNANARKVLVVNVHLPRQMNRDIPAAERAKIYRSLRDGLVMPILGTLAAADRNVILIGDFNDVEGQRNISTDAPLTAPLAWTTGVGKTAKNVVLNTDGDKDWVLYATAASKLQAPSASVFYNKSSSYKMVSDHPYVKQAKFSLAP